MSHRIYFDFIGYFGFTLPMYCGKYHLSQSYCKLVTQVCPFWVDFMEHCYEQLDIIAQKGIKIGLMDYSHSNELIWTSDYSPSDMVGDFIANGLWEPKRLDIAYNNQRTCSHLLQWYLLVMWRAYGWRGIFNPTTMGMAVKLTGGMALCHVTSWYHWMLHGGGQQFHSKETQERKELLEHPGPTHTALQPW
jgi:hypothetical protein